MNMMLTALHRLALGLLSHDPVRRYSSPVATRVSGSMWATCSTCHRLEGIGNVFAPDLSDAGSRIKPELLVRSILEPSAAITDFIASSCSSGAEAIGTAWNMIRHGEVDIALAGGAEAPIFPIAVAGFNSCQALSKRNDNPKGASRPFDSQRDGFVMGEGSAVLVLESEESVRKRDGHILAELVGYGATSDAFHITQPAPDSEGAIRAIRLALGAAGLEPNDVDYINAHGTSTPLNDKFETLAIKTVFGPDAFAIPISSTKSMTGHLLGAGAALEAAITVVAMQKGIIPPTINHQNKDPECDLDYTPNEARSTELHVVMSNSLGFGGHNSSLIFRAVNDVG